MAHDACVALVSHSQRQGCEVVKERKGSWVPFVRGGFTLAATGETNRNHELLSTFCTAKGRPKKLCRYGPAEKQRGSRWRPMASLDGWFGRHRDPVRTRSGRSTDREPQPGPCTAAKRIATVCTSTALAHGRYSHRSLFLCVGVLRGGGGWMARARGCNTVRAYLAGFLFPPFKLPVQSPQSV